MEAHKETGLHNIVSSITEIEAEDRPRSKAGSFGDMIDEEHVRQEKHRTERMAIENEIARQDRDQRKILSGRIFILMVAYMIVVLAVLCISSVTGSSVKVSDPVMIALLGTTTANVIGLFVIVVKYIFHFKE